MADRDDFREAWARVRAREPGALAAFAELCSAHSRRLGMVGQEAPVKKPKKPKPAPRPKETRAQRKEREGIPAWARWW